MKNRKTLSQIAIDFQKKMQKLVDNGEVTSISISSPTINNGKEVVIAKKKPKKK